MNDSDKILKRDNLLIYRNRPAKIVSLILIASGIILFIVMISFNEWIFDHYVLPQIITALMMGTNIALAVWVYKISKRKNQFDVSFLFLTLCMGPLFLLIVSNLDYCFKHRDIKRIVKKYREEFQEKSEQVSGDKSALILEYLKKIEDRLMQERIAEYEKLSTISAATNIPQLNKYINQKINSINALIGESPINEKPDWNPEWNESDEVCPACGARLKESDKFCAGCGLKVS